MRQNKKAEPDMEQAKRDISLRNILKIVQPKLIGEYNTSDFIVFWLSITLFPLGIWSSGYNIIDGFKGINFHNIFFSCSSSLVVISFSVYYGILICKKKQKKILVSVSFAVYSIANYIISDKSYFISYILIALSLLLLIFSINSFRAAIVSVLIFLYIFGIVLISKIFNFIPGTVEFNTSGINDHLFIVILFIFSSILVITYVILNEFYEKNCFSLLLEKLTLTGEEKRITLLHLSGYTVHEICKRMNKDIKNYRVHRTNIKKKLRLYNDFTKNNLRNLLKNSNNENIT